MKTLLEIEPEYRAALEAAGLADFEAMMRAPAAGPPASKHAHRETVPLEISVDGIPRRFFLKRVFKVPPRHAVLPLLRLKRRISQPRHEWGILGGLAEHGIPAMKRAAVGEARGGGRPTRAFLLVESIPYETTLEDWLVPGFQNHGPISIERRDSLLESLGALVGRIHGCGFRWPDIHPKHIFARPVTGHPSSLSWEFRIIDVERMWSDFRSSNKRQIIVNKSMLEDLFEFQKRLYPATFSRIDMLRFSRGYRAALLGNARYESVVSSHQVRGLIHVITEVHALPRLHEAYVHPRKNMAVSFDGITADSELRGTLGQVGIRSIHDIFNYSDGRSLSKPGLASYRDRTRLTLSGNDGAVRTCFLKRYRSPPITEQFRRMREHDRRDSSAKREAHFIKHLSMIGIPTMRTLAWGQVMSGPWEKRSFIITEEIRGESLETLADRATKDPTAMPTPGDRHEIIRQLALIARHMHRYRFFHRDLYLCHVFLTRNADGGIVLRLIDLARMIHKPLAHQRWVTKDLAALDYSSPSPLVTRADRFRFLYHYLRHGSGRTPKDAFRQLILRIARRVDKMARHDVSRGAQIDRKARPLKIAIVIERFEPWRGGAETSTQELSRLLSARGHDVHLITTTNALAPPGLTIHRIPGGTLLRPLRMAAFLRRSTEFLRSQSFDMVHAISPLACANTYQPRGGLLGETLERNVATRSSRPRRLLKQALLAMNVKRRSLLELERSVFREGGPVILAVSKYVARQCERIYDATAPRVRVVFNGVTVPLPPESTRAAQRRDLRAQYDQPEEKLLLLFVAHNFRLKGLSPLIETVSRLVVSGFEGFHLLVVGRDNPIGYQRRIHELGVDRFVTFSGPTQRSLNYLHAADVLVHPTYYDPCSRVVLEAVSVGLPCITTAFNGAAEILTDGHDGFVIDSPDAVGMWARRIQELADPDLRRRMAQRALELRDRVSMQRHVEELDAVFRELLLSDMPKSGIAR